MEEEDEEDDEENDALLARVDFHLLRELRNHRVLALQQLEYFGEAEHAQQLVQFANLGETRQNCRLPTVQQDDVDGQD